MIPRADNAEDLLLAIGGGLEYLYHAFGHEKEDIRFIAFGKEQLTPPRPFLMDIAAYRIDAGFTHPGKIRYFLEKFRLICHASRRSRTPP